MKPRGVSLILAAVALASVGALLADGTETLGTPSIPISSGTGIVAGGTGMFSQPGSITVEVPAGATVKQVLLYWEGFSPDGTFDNTILVSAGGPPTTEVFGSLIGGPTFFFTGAYASTLRADITGLGLVTNGTNTLMLGGLNFGFTNNGAGVLVIIDDGSSDAMIDIRDGSDLAFIGFPPPLQTTAPQTFSFPAEPVERTALLDMFFASVSGTSSGGGLRPTSIELTTNGPGGGTTVLSDLLDSVSGDEFDYFTIGAAIPAGADMLTVQAFSRDDNSTGRLPASFDWLAAGFSLEPLRLPGRMTGGGSVFTVDGVRVTRGFEIHCDTRDPNNLQVNWQPGNRFHLTNLTSAVCIDSPAIQAPPNAPFDTFTGTGEGRLNNVPGARIEFVFVDAGEPGADDTALIKVFDPDNNLVLEVSGFLDRGNIQAHKDNQSLF